MSLIPKDMTPVYKATIAKGRAARAGSVKSMKQLDDASILLRAQYMHLLTEYVPVHRPG
jgi:hypothetical protein